MTPLLKRLDRFPPCLIRYLAHRKGRMITARELSEELGWCHDKVRFMFGRTTWEGVTVGDMELFARACGFPLDNLIKCSRRFTRAFTFYKLRHLSDSQAARFMAKWQSLPKDHPARPENRK